MNADELDALEALARKATPGPWDAETYLYASPDGRVRVTSQNDSPDFNLAEEVDPADAEYIAAANPSTVLALIRRLRTAENVVKGYDTNFPCDGGCNVNDGPEETCSRHGRSPSDLWNLLDQARADLHRAQETIETIEDFVTRHYLDTHMGRGVLALIDPTTYDDEAKAAAEKTKRGVFVQGAENSPQNSEPEPCSGCGHTLHTLNGGPVAGVCGVILSDVAGVVKTCTCGDAERLARALRSAALADQGEPQIIPGASGSSRLPLRSTDRRARITRGEERMSEPTNWRGEPLWDDFRLRMDTAGWAWLRINELLWRRWARKVVRWINARWPATHENEGTGQESHEP